MTCSPWLLRDRLQWAQVQQGLWFQTMLAKARMVCAGVVLIGMATAGWRFVSVPGRLALAGREPAESGE